MAAILVDARSGRVLYEKNADEKRMIASITKLMTGLVAVESTPDILEIVTIKTEWTDIEGTSIYLKAGEQLSLETLLYGMLLESGNDAALAVAGCCAGNVETFVGWMTRGPRAWACKTRILQTPTASTRGPLPPHPTMAKLAAACMENELIARIVSTISISFGVSTFTNHNKAALAV